MSLLAPDPRTFKDAGRPDGGFAVDLQLSGHTHGRQIGPFGYLARLVIPYFAGFYMRGESVLHVSRGTGVWGPLMRLGAPAEITEVILTPAVAPPT